jgi:hypothetical protein
VNLSLLPWPYNSFNQHKAGKAYGGGYLRNCMAMSGNHDIPMVEM